MHNLRIFVTAFALAAHAISGTAAQDDNTNTTNGPLGNAAIVDDNPSGAQYMAQLPDDAFDRDAFPSGNVRGAIQAVSMPNGQGVMFHVNFSGLPDSGGPFLYHIHDQPVPDDGNCTATMGHLDPYQRGENGSCDASQPETCQVGDLSGKHGSVNGTNFTATYTDDFASTKPDIGAFFGNRSFVLHYANKTRITCANFEAVQAAVDGSSCCAAPSNTSGSSTTTPSSVVPTSTVGATSTPTTVTTAGAYANGPAHMLAFGAVALVFLL